MADSAREVRSDLRGRARTVRRTIRPRHPRQTSVRQPDDSSPRAGDASPTQDLQSRPRQGPAFCCAPEVLIDRQLRRRSSFPRGRARRSTRGGAPKPQGSGQRRIAQHPSQRRIAQHSSARRLHHAARLGLDHRPVAEAHRTGFRIAREIGDIGPASLRIPKHCVER